MLNLPMRRARCAVAIAGISLLAVAANAPVLAIEPQADFVFDALGPAACEMPPPGFDIARFKALAEGSPDAPIARGEIGGALATGFAGGGLYGADEAGGFVVGVQGMLLDDAPEPTMLCLVLVRLGDGDGTAGPVVGENGLDAAADGAFFGVFKLVQRDADGAPGTVATGIVETGEAAFRRDGDLLSGAISIQGSQATAGDVQRFSARIEFPRAENVLRPALRLNRGRAATR